jgi:hypothetical protein
MAANRDKTKHNSQALQAIRWQRLRYDHLNGNGRNTNG